jgi:predicted TIM-barrel fold metal-dependent hydrolase
MEDPVTPSSADRSLALVDYLPVPALVTPDNTPDRARIPAIDAHNHLGLRGWTTTQGDPGQASWAIPDVAALVRMMDELNLDAIFNLDGGWGEVLQMNLDRYDRAWPGRFVTLANPDWRLIKHADFGDRLARQLEASVAAGARGLKIFKALGLTVRLPDDSLLALSDQRLQPLWHAAAECDVPVLYHVADPKAFFQPLTPTNERWEELQRHPDWHFFGPRIPSFDALMEQQDAMLSANPRTRFQSAHVASNSEDLRWVSGLLDRHPNLWVDFSARLGEVGRQPYTSREFFTRFQDRVIFATDSSPNHGLYRRYSRFLETLDEHFQYGDPDRAPSQGRYRIYGIGLPDDVLRKVYAGNARALYKLAKSA